MADAETRRFTATFNVGVLRYFILSKTSVNRFQRKRIRNFTNCHWISCRLRNHQGSNRCSLHFWSGKWGGLTWIRFADMEYLCSCLDWNFLPRKRATQNLRSARICGLKNNVIFISHFMLFRQTSFPRKPIFSRLP